MYIYPRKQEEQVIEKLDKLVLADKIIEQIELGLTKAQLIGVVLEGSDDVSTFNEVYTAIFEEKKIINSVSLKNSVVKTEAILGEISKDGEVISEPVAEVVTISDKTETEFKADLSSVVTYLDSDKYYTELKKVNDVSTWTALKEKLNIEAA